ncbi:membrane-bound lytic murein transglycosylase MltF [Halomonas sp. MCCC 1A17488]|uniref:Membrane-bound lytic murein transglycosylase F n=1 Tax=Billgrantia sulfidoxydans TaxID=2733484 RepID=A0ABX7W0J1_9GAMM|nr:MULTISPECIES: membrane-bound lytic murein transglycosylase MltF [Halomonas]MCE8016435.1 membrane-bound lytic murein transglycosylase MltF [Halomonas sp. MCCC 1A17488]MCG3239768.1 membrane-bound lytic murein transglycosylase MltF [Halomonas sp. MCCC 1A17488]QPP50330.1 membrane-bound lytic murein transglycosylase MltF [Halomonas sp. SS10-MC5]QTP53948.1 membrane-bound lytic murein transglycosylase MltF [Halomonas sulfidoxydans]
MPEFDSRVLLSRLRLAALLLLGVVLCLAPYRHFAPPKGLLEAIRARDFISIHTRNTPTTYYEGRHGPTGFEYELMRHFAEFLGVSLTLDSRHHIQSALEAARQEGDLAAAALPLDLTQPDLIYSRPILDLQPLLVYRRGLPPVTEINDLAGLNVGTIRDSGTDRVLRELQADHPELGWRESPEVEVAELLSQVENGGLDAAVVFEHQFRINRIFFPGVERGFPLGKPLSLAWAFPAKGGLGLQQEANRFLTRLQQEGRLDELVVRHFGHDDYLEYVGARTFLAHLDERLPAYAELFREAARDTGFDWKLLAALGYQESHWDPEATSPTGVRGLMMLTLPTAGEMGVSDRLDPAQSVSGGARYLRQLKERLPESIQGEDRLYMAMAAYNVGLGHLYDARTIAEERGGDPDSWRDVREALPLLQQHEWHSKTRHGYARGGEPVIYVRNIRRYHEILTYVDRSQQQYLQLTDSSGGEDHDAPLFDIISPLL